MVMNNHNDESQSLLYPKLNQGPTGVRDNLYNQPLEPHLERIFNLSNSVKIFSMIDAMFSLFFIFFSYYFGLYSLLTFIVAMVGYNGAKYLQKNNVLVYLTYQWIKTMAYTGIPIYLFVKHDYKTTMGVAIFYLAIVFIEYYVALIVQRFYNVLKNLNDFQLDLIRTANQSYYIVVW